MKILNKAKLKVMESSRQRKIDHFYSLSAAGSSILDVGVSSENSPDAHKRKHLNFFLKHFRYRPECYTGLGIDDLSGLDTSHPGKRFVQYPGGRFPFEDNEFDWVFSNAVIEHVGDDNNQVSFINEMMRVSKNIFFYYAKQVFSGREPYEYIFLHWNNAIFYKWCETRKPWCTRESVYLFSGKRLRKTIEKADVENYEFFKSRLFGMTMTFTVVIPATR